MMKIAHLSDLHTSVEGLEMELERVKDFDPDLIVVTGDMIEHQTNGFFQNHQYEAEKQRVVWLGMVEVLERVWPATPIVAVPGNHDFCDYEIPGRVPAFDSTTPKIIEVAGIKIAGFSGVPTFMNRWRDEMNRGSLDLMLEIFENTCMDAEIVLTHSPPHKVLDEVGFGMQENVGIDGFRAILKKMPNLKLHAFGHIHECGGETMRQGDVIYSNASCTINKLTLP